MNQNNYSQLLAKRILVVESHDGEVRKSWATFVFSKHMRVISGHYRCRRSGKTKSKKRG